MPKAWRALRDGVVNVLAPVSSLGIHRFKRGSVLIGITIRWQEGSLAKVTIDSVEPDLVACVDFSRRKTVLAAKDFCLEVPDHVVTGWNSRGS
jgi:hypothetical protein